jgi:hypothetical protein
MIPRATAYKARSLLQALRTGPRDEAVREFGWWPVSWTVIPKRGDRFQKRSCSKEKLERIPSTIGPTPTDCPPKKQTSTDANGKVLDPNKGVQNYGDAPLKAEPGKLTPPAIPDNFTQYDPNDTAKTGVSGKVTW